jgi:hypothetical protein
VDLPVAQEIGVFEACNVALVGGLLALFKVVLKTDVVVGVGAQVFAA